jgi:23S rRNA pseudouridine1911/1915/1917 synthase
MTPSATPTAPLEILYEDNHLLAVNKPPGLATMGGTGQATSLVEQARQYIKRRYRKPGNVYLGIVSRLDAPVSGVLLFARTSKAAARLNQQFQSRRVQKQYWAVVAGAVPKQWVECLDWLYKDDRQRRMVVLNSARTDAQQARLRYRALQSWGKNSLVEIELETGRKHQIRAQLASRGHPIVGDQKYGSRQRFVAGIALHARRLVVTHPTRQETLELVAPLPATWQQLGVPNATFQKTRPGDLDGP